MKNGQEHIDETIDRYLLGELPKAEAEQFEERCFNEADLARSLNFRREMLQTIKAHGHEMFAAEIERRRSPAAGHWRDQIRDWLGSAFQRPQFVGGMALAIIFIAVAATLMMDVAPDSGEVLSDSFLPESKAGNKGRLESENQSLEQIFNDADGSSLGKNSQIEGLQITVTDSGTTSGISSPWTSDQVLNESAPAKAPELEETPRDKAPAAITEFSVPVDIQDDFSSDSFAKETHDKQYQSQELIVNTQDNAVDVAPRRPLVEASRIGVVQNTLVPGPVVKLADADTIDADGYQIRSDRQEAEAAIASADAERQSVVKELTVYSQRQAGAFEDTPAVSRRQDTLATRKDTLGLAQTFSQSEADLGSYRFHSRAQVLNKPQASNSTEVIDTDLLEPAFDDIVSRKAVFHWVAQSDGREILVIQDSVNRIVRSIPTQKSVHEFDNINEILAPGTYYWYIRSDSSQTGRSRFHIRAKAGQNTLLDNERSN